MYDFKFKEKKEIQSRPEDFLIFVKRLLPRWANGIPDSECIAIYKVLKLLIKKNKKLTLLETGTGSSTIAMFLFCALNNGRMFSWDTNGSKGSFLRNVINEAICQVLKVDVNKIWKFIPSDSTDPHVGIRVLSELKIKADFCFFDSIHTQQQVMKEINEFEKVASKNFILAFDDAYYKKRYSNFSYTNMLRHKLNLVKIKEPKNNICKPLYIEIYDYLNQRYKRVIKIKDYYKKNYKRDVFFNYYNFDRQFMNKLGMEEKNKLLHRFDAFKVAK
jgi:predicted O-methyltransferase YrrM